MVMWYVTLRSLIQNGKRAKKKNFLSLIYFINIVMNAVVCTYKGMQENYI